MSLIKCKHNNLSSMEREYKYCTITDFFCPDCKKAWSEKLSLRDDPLFSSEQISSKNSPLYLSGSFNIHHIFK